MKIRPIVRLAVIIAISIAINISCAVKKNISVEPSVICKFEDFENAAAYLKEIENYDEFYLEKRNPSFANSRYRFTEFYVEKDDNTDELIPDGIAVSYKPDQVTFPVRSIYGCSIYRSVEERTSICSRIRYIIINTPNGVQNEKAAIDSLQVLFDRGIDFAMLVERYSDEIDSEYNLGDRGWILPGKYIKEVEEASKVIKEGEVFTVTQENYTFVGKLERKWDKRELIRYVGLHEL